MKVRRAKQRVQSSATGEQIDSLGPSEPVGDPRVKVVFVKDPTRMVTLDDPTSPIQQARGAFARIRPPEGLGVAETRSWADSVRAIARAVRVLPTRRSAHLTTSTRVDAKPVGSIRDEVADLIREANDPELFTLNEEILAEVDHG